MERKLTLRKVLRLREVVKVGSDVLLLPEQSHITRKDARALFATRLGGVPKSQSILNSAAFRLLELEMEYESDWYKNGGYEPAWVQELPPKFQGRLRFSFSLQEEDALFIVPSFMPNQRLWGKDEFDRQPTFNAGLSYLIKEDGLCRAVCAAFQLWRLGEIKQLGFLQAPVINWFTHSRQMLSESTRLLHSLDVYVIAMVIGRNMGLQERELNTLGTLTLTHDVATVAGGDSVKLVDSKHLDEDRNYKHVLYNRRSEIRRLQKDYGIYQGGLFRGIHNRGLLGEILDIADKLAYIARDISKTLHHIEIGSNPPTESNWPAQEGLKELLGVLHEFPYPSGIWDSVEEQNGHAVFTDVARLVAFLKVRTLMFRELYYHPTSRFGEYMMSRLFVKVLYDQGKVTKDMLLEMDDGELLMLIDKHFGNGIALDTCSNQQARVATFKTVRGAKSFVRMLERKGLFFHLLDDNRRAIKPGVHMLVKTRAGPKPLSEVDPASAAELQAMAAVHPMVHVYYLEKEPNLPAEKLAMLVEYLQNDAAR